MSDMGAVKKIRWGITEEQRKREEKRIRGALGGKYRRWKGLYDPIEERPGKPRVILIGHN